MPRSRTRLYENGRHALARKIFGGLGRTALPDKDGVKDQIGALGLVLNAMVLFNIRYMDAALDRLRTEASTSGDEDMAGSRPTSCSWSFSAPCQESRT